MVDWKDNEDVRNYHKQYRVRNKDKLSEYGDNYRRKNRLKALRYSRNYYNDNKSSILKRVKKYSIAHKVPITENKRLYNRNYHNNKYNNDIQYKLRVRMCNRFNNAIKKYNTVGKITISRNKYIDYGAIIKHLRPFPIDISPFHLDHIIPLSFFDLTDEEQLRKAWSPINFQLITKSKNESKGNIVDFVKYPEQILVFKELALTKHL